MGGTGRTGGGQRGCLLAVLALLCACRRSGSGADETQVVRALDPKASIGPETSIDSVAYTDREGDQTFPFAVAGGPGALIVWRGNSRPEFAVSERLIYAARIDAAGAPLELVPAAITAPVSDWRVTAPRSSPRPRSRCCRTSA